MNAQESQTMIEVLQMERLRVLSEVMFQYRQNTLLGTPLLFDAWLNKELGMGPGKYYRLRER